jgi:hypothetical protein
MSFKADRMRIGDEELLDVNDMVPIKLMLGNNAKKIKMKLKRRNRGQGI